MKDKSTRRDVPYGTVDRAWIITVLLIVVIGLGTWQYSFYKAIDGFLFFVLVLIVLFAVIEAVWYVRGEKQHKHTICYLYITDKGDVRAIHFLRGKSLVEALKKSCTKHEIKLRWREKLYELRDAENVKYIVAETIIMPRTLEQLGFVKTNYIVSPFTALIIQFTTLASRIVLKSTDHVVKQRRAYIWPRRYILKL